MAYINIPIKDNTTPLSPAEFNYLIDKINNRRLRDLIDVQDSDPLNKNIIRHNGSGWVYYNMEDDFYNKTEINDIIQEGVIDAMPSTYDYVDFNSQITRPNYKEGRTFYDFETKSWIFYNDESDTALNLGEEQRVRVYNNNGETILNGQAVYVTGVDAQGVITVHKSIANDEISSLNTIGIATHDIEVGTYGWVTTSGQVKNVDTSAYTEGAAIWLSDSVEGAYQETRPISPSYEVRMGGIQKSHATEGIIYVESRIISNDQDNTRFFNGAVLEPNEVRITTNGTVVNLSLNSLAANGRLSLIIDQKYLSVADGININLTVGTDSVPVNNFVYISSDGTMTISTSGFPTGGQYIPVAKCIVPSAATSNTYGLYKVHAYTDHLGGSSNQGHLSHINDWIRKREAKWLEGVVLSTSVGTGVSAASIDLSYTSGVISQLHEHTFPAKNTATGDNLISINNFATPYAKVSNLSPTINADSTGAIIGNNKYFSIVVWASVSQNAKDSQIFFNLPSGSYTNITDAVNDVDNHSDYTIPVEYLGTGFLLTRITLLRGTTDVTIVNEGILDLRGTIPSAGGGSVIGGTGISKFDQLVDTPITKIGESLKGVRVNAAETALEYYDRQIINTGAVNQVPYMDSSGNFNYNAYLTFDGNYLKGGTGSIGGNWSMGYNQLELTGGYGGTPRVILKNSGGSGYFQFSGTSGSYVWTAPLASGILALTTDLNNYLPLAGGTVFGGLELSGTSNRFAFKEIDGAVDEKYTVFKKSAGVFGLYLENDTGVSSTEFFRIDRTGYTVATGEFSFDISAPNFILSSDKRLKNNIESFNAFNRIDIDVKTFELNASKGQKRYGVIAQELEKKHPEFVRTDKKGMKSVAYIDLLMAKVAELEARLEKLEK